MTMSTVAVRFDPETGAKLDTIIRLLSKVAESQAQQAISWHLPVTSTAEEIMTVSEMSFFPRADLLAKLDTISAAVDAGRRGEALALLDSLIDEAKNEEW